MEDVCLLSAQTFVYAFSRGVLISGLAGGVVLAGGKKRVSNNCNSFSGGEAGSELHSTSSILNESSNANSRFISNNNQR